MSSSPMMRFDLQPLPEAVVLRKVTVEPAECNGRTALKVQLDAQTSAGKLGVDFGDFPTFTLLPVTFLDGAIEVDVCARLTATAPDYARGFIGIAYRVQEEGERFECAYVRPLNGRKLLPPPPRDRRAVQYFAYPDWKFDRLRAEFPDGPHEAGADIAADEWIALRIDVAGRTLKVAINGQPVLYIDQGLADPAAGKIGLWVDIGTEGYFSNLRVTAKGALL